ncbi:MAG: hypothetical protein GYA51_08920 [Candidatus Methanofastidiosa archaeon]|nr:hypothetical protein [Candidatus Methanofastidiosa archaeon]
MDNIELNLAIYSDNIKSLALIFYDSSEIRKKRLQDLTDKIETSEWTEEEFQKFGLYDMHFDWLLIQSLFISAFSFFENFMKSIAKMIEKQTDTKIKLEDIRGDGNLDTYRKYIFLVGQIKDANGNRKEWQTIKEFKTIRNALVHDNGLITKKISKINEHNLYFGPSKKHIRIRNISFLEDFVKTSIDYMGAIATDTRQKIKT